MKLSEIISQQVICLAEAKSLGTVYSCTADRRLKKIKQLTLADDDETESYLPLRYLIEGKDVLYTVNKLPVYEKQGITIPLRAEVFDTDGVRKGRVMDFEFDQKGITAIELSTGERIMPQAVVNATRGLVIILGQRRVKAAAESKVQSAPDIDNALNVPPSLGKEDRPMQHLERAESAKIPQDKSESGIVAESVGNDIAEQTPKEQPDIVQAQASRKEGAETNVAPHKPAQSLIRAEQSVHTQPEPETFSSSPIKLISGYAFLLGRRVVKQIIYNGSLLIPNGRIVDVDTVELARKHGKLVELTVSSVAE